MTLQVPTVRVSCEFFPPASDEGMDKLSQVRTDLEFLHCEYYSVTYGAGGSTRARTLATIQQLMHDCKQPVMPHLTCVAARKTDIVEILDLYKSWGINRIMALRGDMPSGMFQAGDLIDAKELVSMVRERWGEDAHICVAAYPEIHPRSKTPEQDLLHFREKIFAGANEAVTQYFYNVDAFLRFRDDVHKLGVSVPIVPGIMPITNYVQLARFSDMCGAQIPRWIRKRLESFQNDLPALREFGADVVSGLCARLIAEGVPALHFYSMNRQDAITAIARNLGWIGDKHHG